MDVFSAIKGRRSCRDFTASPVEEEKLVIILEAGGWAPSILNKQPWRFVVLKNQGIKERLKASCQETIKFLHETSGWKWLGKYSVEFLTQAPVIVAVTADPRDTGADQFLPGRGETYAQSCCAAVQNMLLAAYALGLGSLWYTLYDKDQVKKLLAVPPEMDLIGLIPIGYPTSPPGNMTRKPAAELTRVIE